MNEIRLHPQRIMVLMAHCTAVCTTRVDRESDPNKAIVYPDLSETYFGFNFENDWVW